MECELTKAWQINWSWKCEKSLRFQSNLCNQWKLAKIVSTSNNFGCQVPSSWSMVTEHSEERLRQIETGAAVLCPRDVRVHQAGAAFRILSFLISNLFEIYINKDFVVVSIRFNDDRLDLNRAEFLMRLRMQEEMPQKSLCPSSVSDGRASWRRDAPGALHHLLHFSHNLHHLLLLHLLLSLFVHPISSAGQSWGRHPSRWALVPLERRQC